MSEDLGWTREKNGKQREGKKVVLSRKDLEKWVFVKVFFAKI